MLTAAAEVYRSTQKRHDQLFNVYLARPVAALVVVAVRSTRIHPNHLTLLSLALFVAGAACLAFSASPWPVALMVVSYVFDCADGMLARHKKLNSPTGALFDFFTDELKATLLVLSTGVHLFNQGGLGFDGQPWPAGDDRFLLSTAIATAIVASALSLTQFLRHPVISGEKVSSDAFYETATSPAGLVAQVLVFLRFLNHYPSHIWLFALLGYLDVFFWMYAALNLLYLLKGWLSVVFRFGRVGS